MRPTLHILHSLVELSEELLHGGALMLLFGRTLPVDRLSVWLPKIVHISFGVDARREKVLLRC